MHRMLERFLEKGVDDVFSNGINGRPTDAKHESAPVSHKIDSAKMFPKKESIHPHASDRYDDLRSLARHPFTVCIIV
jgi:hypothetical protein